MAALHELEVAYGQPHRHYHTLQHIAALVHLASPHRHGCGAVDEEALLLAILFHDIVYDPARADNEEASAVLAAERLSALGFPEATVAKVARYIRATRHDRPADADGDTDLALLLDLDLSILAASPDRYRAYAEAVRREYAAVPDELYRAGRRRVLEGLVKRERLYFTEELHALWEKPARANLVAEIATLG
jgi:predicted metal-dependent HD superfamily phosphohydrolase